MKKHLAVLAISFFSVVLVACAGSISQEARSMVTYTGPFQQVQQQPDQYKGETVIWGGKVIDTQVSNGSTGLNVLQLDLGTSNRPREGSMSGGRFVVRANQFLDPAVFSQGTLITVVGKVTGSTVMPIGQMDYRYPVIEPVEIQKWDPVGYSSPRIHFGIGVGTYF